jgi:hypothetical protein
MPFLPNPNPAIAYAKKRINLKLKQGKFHARHNAMDQSGFAHRPLTQIMTSD